MHEYEVVYVAELTVNGELRNSGLFHCKLGKQGELADKLIKLVTKAAIKEKGIGSIWHDYNLCFQVNDKGEKTGGSWDLDD